MSLTSCLISPSSPRSMDSGSSLVPSRLCTICGFGPERETLTPSRSGRPVHAFQHLFSLLPPSFSHGSNGSFPGARCYLQDSGRALMFPSRPLCRRLLAARPPSSRPLCRRLLASRPPSVSFMPPASAVAPLSCPPAGRPPPAFASASVRFSLDSMVGGVPPPAVDIFPSLLCVPTTPQLCSSFLL